MILLSAKNKWRPTLAMIVFVVLATVLMLPLAGLNFFRLFENELVRQTEGELIAQSTVLAAVFKKEASSLPVALKIFGEKQPSGTGGNPWRRYNPLLPKLDLSRNDIKGPRPDAITTDLKPQPAFLQIGDHLDGLVQETQKTTLAGFRILDPKGIIIVGRGDIGLSLAHVEEVSSALKGFYSSTLRQRISDEPPPPVYSISRGTAIRVFIALPVIVEGQVAGVIYASRTPRNIVKYLYGERRNVILAFLAVIVTALVIGSIFLRTITRPIGELISRTRAIGEGDRTAIRPLTHSGTSEIAHLSNSFFSMAKSLFDRSDFVAIFAAHVSHELKSPLTSIQGAAELLRDSGSSMTSTERMKFLDNISSDTQRLTTLLKRLRDLANADKPPTTGRSQLEETLKEVSDAFPELKIKTQGNPDQTLAISRENSLIVFSHLLDNSNHHNATEISIRVMDNDRNVKIIIDDNGDGISEQNRAKVFDTFFTTRRDGGGTGMGLCIVQTMVNAHSGSIQLIPSRQGTRFEVQIPSVMPGETLQTTSPECGKEESTR